jgi:hypothetical protein
LDLGLGSQAQLITHLRKFAYSLTEQRLLDRVLKRKRLAGPAGETGFSQTVHSAEFPCAAHLFSFCLRFSENN